MAALRPARRHDLDALRAVAMLLGIALHASLAYVPGVPWPVQDARPAAWLGVVFLVIHGFRMPLFFLLSGYFTAQLWRSRGCAAMLRQRAVRVLIPLVLANATLVPIFTGLARSGLAVPAGASAAPRPAESPLVAAIRSRNASAVTDAIAAGADVAVPDPEFGLPPVTLAALVGDVDVVRLLLDAGADPQAPGRDGRTPLHAAAFTGRLPVVELLLERGAAALPRSPEGDSPLDSARVDAGTTAFLAGLLRIGLDEATLASNRGAIVTLLAERAGVDATPPAPPPVGRLTIARDAYRGWLLAPRWTVAWWPGGEPRSLVLGDTFNYLWFLWFLCWFAVGFAMIASLATWLRLPAVPRVLVTSPAALLWVVPATLPAQLFMGLFTPAFGPDTSTSLLPQPHLLGYYAVFFAYGALCQCADDQDGRVGRWWPLALVASVAICLPLGLATINDPARTALPQLLYAWLMCWASIGFFRWLVPVENRTWRYLSDSAYWLYLAHLPLLIVLQQISREWPLPGGIKFLLVCLAASGALLASYQLLVRHTPLGLLLNGPRPRTTRG